MKVSFSFNKKVDSINFKNAIIHTILPLELPEFEKDIGEMIIEESYYKYYGNLVIENYPNLEKISVKHISLENLNSLKICNCEKLKIIECENGGRDEDSRQVYYGAFRNVRNVIIESSLGIINVI